MKPAFPFVALFVGATSLAIAPSLNLDIADGPVHGPKSSYLPTVDETSTRSDWVTSYSNDKEDTGKGPTVDATSTRGQWVTKYPNNKEGGGKDPSVDATSTRSQWVTEYSTKEWGVSDHWLPTGPGYLNVNDLEKGYHAHLMIMYDSSSWLQSKVLVVKRYFGVGNV